MEKNGEDEGEEHTTRRDHAFIRHRKTTTIIRRRLTKEDSDVDNKGKNSNTLEELEPKKDQQHRRREAKSSVSFLCGLSAGILQAGLFNPFDRALYLSITNEVPFLRHENFRNPYNGFLQSVGHRALSSGLYYPLENFFCCSILPLSRSHRDGDEHNNTGSPGIIYLHPGVANFLAGTFAGAANALIVNPVTAIKYKSWGRDVNRGMLTEAMEMFRKGGLRPFRNGLISTVLRDLCFGGTYTFLRLELQFLFQLRPEQQWIANMTAAALATVVSAPFNLVRNVQYATRSREKADTISMILRDFMTEACGRGRGRVGGQQIQTTWQRMRFIQNRLRIGWGTVRVSMGMAFGHLVYDNLMGICEEYDNDNDE